MFRRRPTVIAYRCLLQARVYTVNDYYSTEH